VDNATVNGNDMEEVANSFIMEPKKEEETDQVEASEDEAEVDDTPVEDTEGEGEEASYDSEDDETDAEEADQPQSQLIPVKVNGKTEMKTLDDLKQDYAGQAYIQQGMREAAEAKKEALSVFQQLQSERQQLVEFTQQIQSNPQRLQPPVPPSTQMAKEDPIGYIEAQAQYNDDAAAYQQALRQVQYHQHQSQEMSKQQHQHMLTEQMQVLTQLIPEFADPKKAPVLRDKIVHHTVNTYGVDPAILETVTDANQVAILHDAMRYRQMMGTRNSVEQQAQKTRPVIKPGVKGSEKSGAIKSRDKAVSQMKRSGSVDDVAKYLLTR